MKNSIGDNARLHHILDAILEIQEYTKGKSDDDFFRDSMLQSACVRQLEIIGEAASNVSDEIKSKSPGIEWQEIIGLRNILIHEYFGVDVQRQTINPIIQNSSNPLRLCRAGIPFVIGCHLKPLFLPTTLQIGQSSRL